MARTPVFLEVKDSAGNVVAAASINIKKRSNGADATVYNAETAGSVISNPVIADSLGRISVWVDRGDYNAIVSGTGITTYTVPLDAVPGGDAEIDITQLPASVQSLVLGGNTTTVQTGGTMPASPVNGDRCIYTADATNGVTWEFMYRAASASAYKWEMIGGGHLWSEVVTAGDESTASTTYVALTTAGPAITLPLAGDYDVEIGFMGYVNTSSARAVMSYDIGGTGAVDADAVGLVMDSAGVGVHRQNRPRRKTIAAAATTLTSKYKLVGSGTATFRGSNEYGGGRFIRAIPVRVG
jgi:hypothetical protein